MPDTQDESPIDNTERLDEIFYNLQVLFQAVNGASDGLGIAIYTSGNLELKRSNRTVSELKKSTRSDGLTVTFGDVTMSSKETLEDIEAKKAAAMDAFVIAVVMSPQRIQKALEERRECVDALAREI
jgi:hypothetical protein